MSDSSLPRRVRVAASTSNLGPGFDCLGLALSLFLEVRVHEESSEGEHVWLERTGHAALWPEEDDVLRRAFRKAQRLGGGGPACRLSAHSDIPIGRGFGSSGSSIAAGLLLGASLSKSPPDLETLHALGVELEGHPDNVSASLFGGLTLCHPTAKGGGPLLVSEGLNPALRFVLAWTDQSLPTNEARGALPAEVSFHDAVENPRRLGLLLAGLREGRREWIEAGSRDRLHERYRLPLIAGAEETLRAAREAGAWAANISGAGSGLVAVTSEADAGPVAEEMRACLSRFADGAHARVVDPVLTPPAVEVQEGA